MRTLEQLKTSHYSSFTKEEWDFLREAGIVNGFGPSGNSFLQFILKRITPCFHRASADLHDVGYWQGGDIEQFHKCNNKFFAMMLDDARSIGCVRKYYYIFWSCVYFLAVKHFGKKYFNFHEKSI